MNSKCTVCAVDFDSTIFNGGDQPTRTKTTTANSKFAKRKLTRTFCEYFNLSSTKYESNNNDNGLVFCHTCQSRVYRLCHLHRQLKSVQSEICKIVSKLTFTILDTESNFGKTVKNNERTNEEDITKIIETSLMMIDVEHENYSITTATDQNCPNEFSPEIKTLRETICKNYQPRIILTNCNLRPSNRRRRKCVKPLDLVLLSENELEEEDDYEYGEPQDAADDDQWNFDPSSPNASFHHVEDSSSNTLNNNHDVDSNLVGQRVMINDDEATVTIYIKTENVPVLQDSQEKKFVAKKRPFVKKSDDDDDDDYYDDDEDYVQPKRKRVKNNRPKKSSLSLNKRRKPRKTTKNNSKGSLRIARNKKIFEQSDNLFIYESKYGSFSIEQDPVTSYFKCVTCGKSRKSRGDVVRHINCVHNKERPSCLVCGKSWETQERMDGHDCRPKAEDRRKKCSILPEGQFLYDKKWPFEKINNDDDGGDGGGGNTSYKCMTCGSLKSSIPKIYAHLKYHHANPNKFVCETCGRGFPLHNQLVMHQLIHTESREIICHICGKDFMTRKHLCAHMQGHQEKRWTCEICFKTFKYSKGLGKHRRDVNHFKNGSKQQQEQQQQQATQSQQQEIVQTDKCTDPEPEVTTITTTIEAAAAATTTAATTTTFPTDYSLPHLILQERLHHAAEYTHTLRNLQF